MPLSIIGLELNFGPKAYWISLVFSLGRQSGEKDTSLLHFKTMKNINRTYPRRSLNSWPRIN
jgi:hypothetical protein